MVNFQRALIALLLVGVCLLGGAWMFSEHRARKLRSELSAATGALQAEELEKSGWRESALRMKEVELPALRKRLEQASATNSTPVARIRARTESTTVQVDPTVLCGDPLEKSISPLGTSVPVVAETVPLSFDLASDLQLALDMTDDGRLFYTGKLFTSLSGPLFPTGRVIEQDLSSSSEVALSGAVRKALDYYRDRPSKMALLPRSYRHWRMGLTLGVGAMWEPSSGHMVLAPTLTFGVQL